MNKEILQKQLDDLKAKVAEIEGELQRKSKFEFKYEEGETYLLNTHYVDGCYSGDDTIYIQHGRYRKTREVADDAIALQKAAMRLHALVEQLNGFEGKYQIYYATEWCYASTGDNIITPGVVLMTKECAEEICRLLNDGEVEL